MNSNMKLSKALFVLVIMLFGNSVYSQNKKEQIESLNYKIDSLVQVIQSQRKLVDEKLKEIKGLNQLNDSISIELSRLVNENALITDLKEKLQIENKKLEVQNDQLKIENEQFKIQNKLLFEKIESSKSFSEFICMKYFSEDEIPYSDLGFKSKADSDVVKISTVIGFLEIIQPDEFANYQIPQKAMAARGGWYAGGGDYFYYIEENGNFLIYKGWQDEVQEDSGFHWEKFKVISK